MTTHYKYTHADLTTYSGHKWVVGEWVETDGESGLCGPGWLHAYASPEEAAMMDPIQGQFTKGDPDAPLWLVEGDGELKIADDFKLGRTRLRLAERVNAIRLTTEQRVEIAILCALTVYGDEDFETWACAWLDASDQSREAAEAARAAWAAARAEAWAARAAAWAATAAAWAATAARAAAEEEEAEAARAAAWAATAAAAAWAATAAAEEATAAEEEAAWAAVDFREIVRLVLDDVPNRIEQTIAMRGER